MFHNLFSFYHSKLFFIYFTECIKNTFQYEGKCYTSCPERAFMLPEGTAMDLDQPSVRKSASLKARRMTKHRRDTENGNETERAIKMPIYPQKLCAPCHFSCLKCKGPNDYDCTDCAPDAVYTEKSTNEAYCSAPTPTNYDQIYAVLLVVIPVLTLFFVIVSVSWMLKIRYCSDDKIRSSYAYDKIAFDGKHIITPSEKILSKFGNDDFSSDESENENYRR